MMNERGRVRDVEREHLADARADVQHADMYEAVGLDRSGLLEPRVGSGPVPAAAHLGGVLEAAEVGLSLVLAAQAGVGAGLAGDVVLDAGAGVALAAVLL